MVDYSTPLQAGAGLKDAGTIQGGASDPLTRALAMQKLRSGLTGGGAKAFPTGAQAFQTDPDATD